MTVQFKEIKRVNVSPATDIVISEVIEYGVRKGFHINNYITTPRYTGFAKGGIFVPTDKVREVQDMLVLALE